MCTQEEARKASEEAVEDVLFKPDAQGHTRFGREVHDAIFEADGHGNESRFQRELRKAFYTTFGKWFFGGGAAILLGLALLYFQVQDHEERLAEGGRYTQEDAIEDTRIQENRDNRQDEAIDNLREETNDKFNIINGKLDRLIDKLIP